MNCNGRGNFTVASPAECHRRTGRGGKQSEPEPNNPQISSRHGANCAYLRECERSRDERLGGASGFTWSEVSKCDCQMHFANFFFFFFFFSGGDIWRPQERACCVLSPQASLSLCIQRKTGWFGTNGCVARLRPLLYIFLKTFLISVFVYDPVRGGSDYGMGRACLYQSRRLGRWMNL